MGQKVHPHGFRVGIIKDWDARWTAKKSKFADYIVEDDKIRKFLKKKLYAAGISKIEIERAAQKVSVNIFTGKPGIVIGKGGTGEMCIRDRLEPCFFDMQGFIDKFPLRPRQKPGILWRIFLSSRA